MVQHSQIELQSYMLAMDQLGYTSTYTVQGRTRSGNLRSAHYYLGSEPTSLSQTSSRTNTGHYMHLSGNNGPKNRAKEK